MQTARIPFARQKKLRAQVQTISAQLAKLTAELNQFRPASETIVGENYEKDECKFPGRNSIPSSRKYITCLLWY